MADATRMSAGLLVLILGIAALAGGLLLFSYSRTSESGEGEGPFGSGDDENREEANTLQTTGIAVLVMGAVATILGIVLLAMRRSTA